VLGRRRTRRLLRLTGSHGRNSKARGFPEIVAESPPVVSGGERGSWTRRGLEVAEVIVREIGGFRGRVGGRAFAVAFRETLVKRFRSTRLVTRTKESNMYASFRA